MLGAFVRIWGPETSTFRVSQPAFVNLSTSSFFKDMPPELRLRRCPGRVCIGVWLGSRASSN